MRLLPVNKGRVFLGVVGKYLRKDLRKKVLGEEAKT